MNTLDQMGIQQWRLRSALERVQNAVPDAPADLGDFEEINQSAADIATTDDPPPVETEQSLADIRQPSADPYSGLDWQGLQATLGNPQLCQSCSPSNSILGSGDTHADWMFVTDAPGSNDVQQDQMITGRAGKLFEAILLAVNLDRDTVYTTSVFKCAPTDDLSISPSCNKLLRRQIELVQPKVVVTFGEFAAQAVIKANEPIEALRQREQQCFSTNVAIVPTYSPAQMLDEPALKALVWADLKKCLRIINE